MSGMKTLDQRGLVNALLVPLILVIIFFLGAAGFGYWAFNSRQDYKNNSDQKVAVAVEAAQKRTQAADAKQYAEEAKQPLKTYVGPSSFGAITVQYPKTWSSYVIEKDNNDSRPIDAFFHPDFVPDTTNQDKSFALRIQLVSQSYDDVLSTYSGAAKNGKVTIAPYRLAKVPTVIGSVITGQLDTRKQGTLVILPLRNMTLKIWADSSEFLPDLTNIILPNFSFTP
jgi:hypothetical protein